VSLENARSLGHLPEGTLGRQGWLPIFYRPPTLRHRAFSTDRQTATGSLGTRVWVGSSCVSVSHPLHQLGSRFVAFDGASILEWSTGFTPELRADRAIIR
jgi:hypothetical protein